MKGNAEMGFNISMLRRVMPISSLENVFWNIYRMLKSNNTPRLFYVLEPTVPQAIVSVRLSANSS